MKKFDITGVGYTAIDYLGIIPHFPEENLKLELDTLEVQGGGPAATATVTAARLGLTTAFIGKVGGDDRGDHGRQQDRPVPDGRPLRQAATSASVTAGWIGPASTEWSASRAGRCRSPAIWSW